MSDGDEEWTRFLGVRSGELSDEEVDDMGDDFGQAETDGKSGTRSPHPHQGY